MGKRKALKRRRKNDDAVAVSGSDDDSVMDEPVVSDEGESLSESEVAVPVQTMEKKRKKKKGVPAVAHDMASLRRMMEAEAEAEAAAAGSASEDESDAAPAPRTTVELAEQHIRELEELRRTDPKFFAFLQKNEPALLDFSVADVEKEEDENPSEDEGEGEGEGEAAPAGESGEEGADAGEAAGEGDVGARDGDDLGASHAYRRAKTVVTTAMLERLEVECLESVGALRRLVMVFKCACHVGDDAAAAAPDGKEKGKDKDKDKAERLRRLDAESAAAEREAVLPYKIPNSSVFNRVMTFCLSNMRAVIEHHLRRKSAAAGSNVQQQKGKKKDEKKEEKKEEGPMSDDELGAQLRQSNARWSAIAGTVKAFLGNVVYFVDKLTQDELRVSTLALLEPYAVLVAQYPGVAKALLNVLLDVWAGAGEQARLLAFTNVLALARRCPLAFLDVCLRGAYLTYIRAFGRMQASAVPLARFMRNCIVELFGVNAATAYRIAFAYIRQLAVHLRAVVTGTARDGARALQNWQFVGALRVWTDVLCAHARARTASMHQLVYPLAQIVTGALDLCVGTPCLPVRFHLIAMMNDLTDACRVLVNPVVPLLRCLDTSELRRRARRGTILRPLDFATLLHVSRQYLTSPELQDAVVRAFYEHMLRFLAATSYSPAFPELAVPVLAFLRRYRRESRIPLLSQQLAALVEKTTQNVAWINAHRASATFLPRDRAAVAAFLADERAAHQSPLDAAWVRFAAQKEHLASIQHQSDLQAARAEQRRKQRELESDGDDSENDDDNEDNENDFDGEEDVEDEEEDTPRVRGGRRRPRHEEEEDEDEDESKYRVSANAEDDDDDDDVEEYPDPEAEDSE